MKKLSDEEKKRRNRESNRRYRLNHPDQVKASNRYHYLKNKDKTQGWRAIDRLLEPMDMTKREIESLEAKISRLKARPLEELIYQRA